MKLSFYTHNRVVIYIIEIDPLLKPQGSLINTTILGYILMYLDLFKGILMNDNCIYKANMSTTMKLGIHMASVTSIKILQLVTMETFWQEILVSMATKLNIFNKMVWRSLITNCIPSCHISLERGVPRNIMVCLEFEYIVNCEIIGKNVLFRPYFSTMVTTFHQITSLLIEIYEFHNKHLKAEDMSFPLIYHRVICLKYLDCARPF